jgi:hypothetical protein
MAREDALALLVLSRRQWLPLLPSYDCLLRLLAPRMIVSLEALVCAIANGATSTVQSNLGIGEAFGSRWFCHQERFGERLLGCSGAGSVAADHPPGRSACHHRQSVRS